MKPLHHLRCPTRGPRAGILLVEAVASLGILILIGLAGASTQLTCISLLRTSRETKVAVTELDTAMEAILSLPLEDIPDPAGPYAPDTAIAAFTGRYLENEAIQVRYPNLIAGNPVPDPLEIELTLTWNDYAGRERELRVVGAQAR